MQMRWKTAKQREEHDQVGSEGLIRSRQMRHERAPAEDDVRNDWIFDRSAPEWPENSRYGLKMESERSEWRCVSVPEGRPSASESESESMVGGGGGEG